jgi:hypothetical protein
MPVPKTWPSPVVPYHGLLDIVSQPVAMEAIRRMENNFLSRITRDLPRTQSEDDVGRRHHHESTHKTAGVV